MKLFANVRRVVGKALFPFAAAALWLGLVILSLVMITLHPKNALADLRSMRQARRPA